MKSYWIKLDDGRWIKVSENIYTDWTGGKNIQYPNGKWMFNKNGTMFDENGRRSIFDDVDE